MEKYYQEFFQDDLTPNKMTKSRSEISFMGFLDTNQRWQNQHPHLPKQKWPEGQD